MFHFNSGQNFQNFLVIFYFISGLFKIALFNFQIFGYFPVIFIIFTLISF